MISSLSALLPSHSTAGQLFVPTPTQAATTAPGVCLLAGIADRAMDLVDGIRGAAEMQLQHLKKKEKCKSWCHRDGCGKRAHYTGAGDAERFCLQHKNATHTLIYRSRTTTSRCHILGCAKQPNFGSLGGAALYCHTHKQLHHCNVNRPTCSAEGCTKTRSFGEEILEPNEERGKRKWDAEVPNNLVGVGSARRNVIKRRRGRALYCRAHMQVHHVNLHNCLCGYKGCELMGMYGNATVGYMCSQHRVMIQAGRRCKHPEGCLRAAFFGSSADNTPVFCIHHRRPSHVNCMVRTCSFVEGCRQQPSFGASNDTLASYCKKHKNKMHVNIKHHRCAYLGCSTIINPHKKRGRPPRGATASATTTATATRTAPTTTALLPAATDTQPHASAAAAGAGAADVSAAAADVAAALYENETRFLCQRHAELMTRIRPPLRPTLVFKRKSEFRRERMGEREREVTEAREPEEKNTGLGENISQQSRH